MIVPMEKVTVLTLDRHRDETLERLRDLGVIHPEPGDSASAGESVEARRQTYQATATVVNQLKRRAADMAKQSTHPSPSAPTMTAATADAPADPMPRISGWLNDLKQLEERRALTIREIRETEPVGDFDPQALRDLERNGITVRLFRRSGKSAITVPDGVVLSVLHRDRTQTIYAVIGPYEPLLGDQPLTAPDRSLGAMREDLQSIERQIDDLNNSLNDAVTALPVLQTTLARQADALRFAEIRSGMRSSDRLVYLQGYCPVDRIENLRTAAREAGWALLIETPAPGDTVPTLIRHPEWVRPIQSVLRLMGILPGYREIDVSAAFLLFFSLFFAMIVGDAGYGVIFLGLTVLAKHVWGRIAPPEPFRLMTVLSVCTIIWGALSGNVFGTSWFPTLVPWLNDRENMMLLCFLIGAIHLSVAHGWNALTIMNSPQALAQVGWIGLTWTMFLTARSLILGYPFPGWAYGMLALGLGLVIVFMTPRRLMKTEWISHAMLPLTIINNFVDVVSYVRLFAVGYATLAVAEAFNNMALTDDMGWMRGVIAALILFAGHTLNIVLCALSVLVHGIRLNTLEFSGHIGMQWTGFGYHPFTKETPANK